MPLTKYCICGHPNLYTLEIPIFCTACGTKFEGSISVASQKSKIQSKLGIKPTIDDFQDDNGVDIDDINVSDLDEEIEENPKKHKLYGQTSRNNKKIKRVSREIDDNDDDIDIDDLNINALQLNIPISTKKDKGVTLGQVIKEQKTGIERPKPKKVNKKKELETFRIEAGMGGRKDISIEAPEDRE